MGHRSGYFTAHRADKTSVFKGSVQVDKDFIVNGNFTFGDASTDDLTIGGHISVAEAKSTKFIETGTYSSSASKGIVISSTNARPVAFLFDDGGVELTGDIRAVLSRVLLSVDHTEGVTVNSIRGHLKALNLVDITNTNSVIAPITGYLELEGTGARTVAGHVACMRAAVEEGASGTTTISASSYYSGFEATLNSSRTYTSNGVFSAFTVNTSAGTSNWDHGVYIADDATDIGIEIGNVSDASIVFGTPSNEIFRFDDDQTICSDDNQAILADISSTSNAGFIKVVVGSSDRYIALYELKAS